MANLFTDTGDLITTSNLWVDSDLSQVAPDGWYQSGGLYRRLQNGELLPAVTCEECGSIPTIEVAAILLLTENSDCSNDNTEIFSNIIYVRSDWAGFIENGDGKLVVDNQPLFAQPDVEIVNPATPGVVVSSKSIVTSQPTILPGSALQGSSYLVQFGSLNDQSGVDILGTFSSSSEVTFNECL
jgi:hypothetical protein